MIQSLINNDKILMEGAIVERLRRSTNVKLHSELVNSLCIYNECERKVLQALYKEYVDIAMEAKLPILTCTPTWRANYDRVTAAKAPMTVNADAVDFLKDFRQSLKASNSQMMIGGLIGCKNDCYKPQEGLQALESQRFHSWQIEQLATRAVDFLIAETLPSVEEALGIAREMAHTKIPYIISFVISKDARVLDGTQLIDAIQYIDDKTDINPMAYMVNCAYPSFICPSKQPKLLFKRLIGFQANASSLDHCELDGATQLKVNDLSEWGDLMLKLNKTYGVKILGGCCGTNASHLKYITSH